MTLNRVCRDKSQDNEVYRISAREDGWIIAARGEKDEIERKYVENNCEKENNKRNIEEAFVAHPSCQLL